MIYRTYQCVDCDAMFEVAHDSGSEPFPDCPNCAKVLEWRPQRIAIGGSVEGKAVRATQRIMEEDYGLTNFKDNNRQGDVGYIDPTRKTTVEREKIERETKELVEQVSNTPAAKAFWGGNEGTATNMNSMTGQSLIQMAKVGPQGVDPMAVLHGGVKSGKLPTIQQMTTKYRAD